MTDRIEASSLATRIKGQADKRVERDFNQLCNEVHKAFRIFCRSCGVDWTPMHLDKVHDGREHARKLALLVMSDQRRHGIVTELPFYVQKMEHRVIDDILASCEALRELAERVEDIEEDL